MAPRKTKKETEAMRKKAKQKKESVGPKETSPAKTATTPKKTGKQEKDKARMDSLKKKLEARVTANIIEESRQRNATAAASDNQSKMVEEATTKGIIEYDKKRKASVAPSSNKASTSKKGKKQSTTKTATAEEIDNAGTESEDSDGERKPAAVEERDKHPPAEEEKVEPPPPEVGRAEGEQAPEDLMTALIEAEERATRAERQVRAISKIRIADTFQEGQVRTWAKETLWKMCKFITNEKTMNQVMAKASKHFQITGAEKQQWMATFAHIVRDGLNQKRNACTQDLRKSLKSKLPEQPQQSKTPV